MISKLKSTDLDLITEKTLRHYEESAESFWLGTKDHDVSQNYQALLSHLGNNFPSIKSYNILDFGCGPGRDVQYFKKMGHQPTGLDGCLNFCQMTQNLTKCPTLNQNFLSLDLKPDTFHGVFANASLFHVPRQELPRILNELQASLIPNGIFFSSNPRGDVEGWIGNRYGTYMEYELYRAFLANAGFEILTHYYRPKGNPPEEQPWLAVIAQK